MVQQLESVEVENEYWDVAFCHFQCLEEVANAAFHFGIAEKILSSNSCDVLIEKHGLKFSEIRIFNLGLDLTNQLVKLEKKTGWENSHNFEQDVLSKIKTYIDSKKYIQDLEYFYYL